MNKSDRKKDSPLLIKPGVTEKIANAQSTDTRPTRICVRPTPTEIAMLAVEIAKLQPKETTPFKNPDPFGTYLSQALDLWRRAERLLRDHGDPPSEPERTEGDKYIGRDAVDAPFSEVLRLGLVPKSTGDKSIERVFHVGKAKDLIRPGGRCRGYVGLRIKTSSGADRREESRAGVLPPPRS